MTQEGTNHERDAPRAERLHWAAEAYGDLKDRRASMKARKSGSHVVTFGPTGAAKALYALRPNALPPWEGSEGQAIESCTLLTTVPNDLIRTFHHRMPITLAPEAYALWLDPAMQEPDSVQPFLRPYPPDTMIAYPVSLRVNNPDTDSPGCIEPLP